MQDFGWKTYRKICCEKQALMDGNIKVHLKGRGCNSDYWIYLAQMEKKRWALVNTAVDFRVP